MLIQAIDTMREQCVSQLMRVACASDKVYDKHKTVFNRNTSFWFCETCEINHVYDVSMMKSVIHGFHEASQRLISAGISSGLVDEVEHKNLRSRLQFFLNDLHSSVMVGRKEHLRTVNIVETKNTSTKKKKKRKVQQSNIVLNPEMLTLFYLCGRKTSHITEADAWLAAAHSHNGHISDLNVYVCVICTGFHVGHKQLVKNSKTTRRVRVNRGRANFLWNSSVKNRERFLREHPEILQQK